MRTYTVRAWDPDANRLTLDFVVHGDEGLAGPWAAAAKPGDLLQLVGPGGAYTPDPSADWHLFVGDASVIPAIQASLPRIAPGTPVRIVLQVDGPQEQQPLVRDDDPAVEVTWLHDPLHGAEQFVAALRELDFPSAASTPSSTARRPRCARCAGTSSSSAGSSATSCRPPATGS